jgi:putative SOS response-associated peptidase YedK
VRVESLNAPFYRDSIHGRRCLIIADGFYEWKISGDPEAKKPIKQPYLIRRPDGKPFAFARMWYRALTRSCPATGSWMRARSSPRRPAALLGKYMTGCR